MKDAKDWMIDMYPNMRSRNELHANGVLIVEIIKQIQLDACKHGIEEAVNVVKEWKPLNNEHISKLVYDLVCFARDKKEI